MTWCGKNKKKALLISKCSARPACKITCHRGRMSGILMPGL